MPLASRTRFCLQAPKLILKTAAAPGLGYSPNQVYLPSPPNSSKLPQAYMVQDSFKFSTQDHDFRLPRPCSNVQRVKTSENPSPQLRTSNFIRLKPTHIGASLFRSSRLLERERSVQDTSNRTPQVEISTSKNKTPASKFQGVQTSI